MSNYIFLDIDGVSTTCLMAVTDEIKHNEIEYTLKNYPGYTKK